MNTSTQFMKAIKISYANLVAAYLKRHTHTVHEGHKDYKCESCGKSFSQTSALKNHIYTIHEGHKDNKCESCGKSFSEAGTSAQFMKATKITNVTLVANHFLKQEL